MKWLKFGCKFSSKWLSFQSQSTWKELIAFRLRHPTVHRSRYFTGAVNERGLADLTWHGCTLGTPSWDDPNARVLACTLGGMLGDEADIHLMMNMYWEPLSFAIPSVPGRRWYRAVDTGLAAPEDIATAGQEVAIATEDYVVGGRSVVVLISK